MSRQFIPLLAVVLLSTGCAGRYDSQATAPAEADSIYIDALNEHFYDARVHAVYTGGQRRSLGTVVGNGGHTRTAVMWEPHALVFEISFIISGAQYVSHPVNVSRGEVVDLRLPANIDQSGFFRRVARNSPPSRQLLDQRHVLDEECEHPLALALRRGRRSRCCSPGATACSAPATVVPTRRASW